MDWLGSIGGIEEILNKLLVFLFGGFLQFNAVLSTFNALRIKNNHSFHSHKQCSDDSNSEPETVEEAVVNLSTCERIQIYLIHSYECFNFCLGRV